ncbi:MAG: carboxypeptidase regulatory-like domain-containing protein [Terriglobales bacterium]
MNWNFQLGMHPNPDQLSVFVEGAATSREHERMLAHLAECAECRKAVFLIQPHEETQPATRTPVKGWIWGRLLPVGLPAAALACGLIVVFIIYIRPHGGAPGTPQQIASLRKPEVQLPQTTVAPTTDSERVAPSEGPKNSFVPHAATDLSRQENRVAGGLNLPKSKSDQIAANVEAPQTTAAAPSVTVPVGHGGGAAGAVFGGTVFNLPLNGRNVTDLDQPSTAADTKAAASQNSLAKERTLPQLEIAQSGQAEALAGVSGRITDPSGAIVSGASVSLRDAAGKTRQTTTSADGSFHLTELPAGQYELIATARGFKTLKESFQLNPSQLAMLQPMLELGATTEQVTVEAGTQAVQTEDAALSQNVDSRVWTGNVLSQNVYTRVFGGNGDGQSVSHGKRSLSLDTTGNLFMSRNRGKKWKKITPQWTGKAVRVELTPAYESEVSPRPEDETSGQANDVAVFQLTTDAGTVWTSKDGAHWHQR